MKNETNLKTNDANTIPQKVTLSEVKSEAKNGDKFLAGNYAIISDLKLNLEAMVGTAELSVEELFALQTGSVVKLKETIDTALTLRFEGKPVAIGSLVVVGDNFGIQITEILNSNAKLTKD
ncbi:MAG: FliM/FliN family flagellar motor switch protein [Methylotenera sp.]